MVEVDWQAAVDGRYWIDVTISDQPVRVMIDLGLIDPVGAVGFEVDPDLYDQMKRARSLSRFQVRFRRDASGQVTASESGATNAQLRHPGTNSGIGPVVQLHGCAWKPRRNAHSHSGRVWRNPRTADTFRITSSRLVSASYAGKNRRHKTLAQSWYSDVGGSCVVCRLHNTHCQ